MLFGVEAVLVTSGTSADELADEPHTDVDGDDESQTDQSDEKNHRVE